jgi:coiled-coil-helix-coiled-coil-helix domain-containing protein 2
MSNLFFGGSGAQQHEEAPLDPYAANSQGGAEMQRASAQQGPCVPQVQGFKLCLEQNNNDLTVCGWYMEQLKACQAAASKY